MRTGTLLRQTPLLVALLASSAPGAAVTPAYRGPDLSGTYVCTGHDHQDGPYTGTVTLALLRTRSTGAQASYDFRLDVPGYGSYPGHAAAQGRYMAISFANTDPTTHDYGTGIARFHRQHGKWAFDKFYHEPEYKGGNFGTEHCVQR